MIEITGNDWDELLQEEYKKDYFQNMMRFLDMEYRREDIFPPMADVFNALAYTSYKDTKVVIVGQDPYINPNEAHGFSFSVRPGVKIPPSLANIFKEIHDDCNCYIPNNGCLIPWAQQGVLLLNSILTVRRGQSRSHANIGWEVFTNKIMDLLNDDTIGSVNGKSNSRVFMLWGNYAKQKADRINTDTHLVLKAAHPSPLAGGAFFGCKHFSKTNQYLYEISDYSIDWQIPNIEYKGE